MEVYDVAVVPLIIGLVELLKQLGLPSGFAALASVVIGALIGVYYINPGDVVKGIIVGVSLGLAASGLYSGTRSTVDATKATVESLKKRIIIKRHKQ